MADYYTLMIIAHSRFPALVPFWPDNKIILYWPSLLGQELGQYTAILTSRLVKNAYIYPFYFKVVCIKETGTAYERKAFVVHCLEGLKN